MKKLKFKWGLSYKMILSIFTSVFFITAIIFYYIYNVSHNTILANLKENSRLLTESTVNEVEKVLTAVQKIPDNLSKIFEAGNYTAEQMENLLHLTVRNNSEIFGAAITFEPDYNGPVGNYSSITAYQYHNNIISMKTEKGQFTNYLMDWYLIPKELEKPLWSEPYLKSDEGSTVMSTYSVPLYRYSNGKKIFIGIISADLSLEWLQQLVTKIKVCETGYAFMISGNGSFTTHPRKELIMNATMFTLAEEMNSPLLRRIGRNMIKGETSFADAEYYNATTGKLSWISYAPVKINGWSLGIVYPVEELTTQLDGLFKMVIILSIIGAVILLTVITLISRSITSPLRKLAFTTQKIGEGNFNVEIPEYEGKDEIGELTKTFYVMQEALKRTIQQLKMANVSLEEYSRTLEDKVEMRTAELSEKNHELDKAIENVKTLSQIGQEITSTLNLESIFTTVYAKVNSLLEATSFSIMLINEKECLLECKLAIENNERLPEFSFSTNDKNRFAVWCVDNRKPVFINDVDTEYIKYIATRSKPKAGQYVSSLIYLPLMVGDRIIGVISAQSFRKNAYSESHLDILSNLANYIAIALDNAYAYENVNRANNDLKEAQTQLIQAEKMASLGQLTAGIAHEIKNPLNFINNFSDLSIGISQELLEEVEAQKERFDPKTVDYLKEILTDLNHNVIKINEHGKRADSIVRGMLLHSRGKAGEKQKTNINDLLMEYLNLAYHGFRAQDSTFNIKMESDYDSSLEPVNVVPQNISRVFLNIFNNGCYSVNEKKKEKKDSYNPQLSVATKNLGDKIEIRIKDNGKGIPQDILDKIFNPFFTTKPTGKGTGLGLSLSYDIIVQEHKGDLKVISEPGEFAEFIITLPKNL